MVPIKHMLPEDIVSPTAPVENGLTLLQLPALVPVRARLSHLWIIPLERIYVWLGVLALIGLLAVELVYKSVLLPNMGIS